MSTPYELFAAHRARVTPLLLGAAPPGGGRLGLLGAGRCRDVDLLAAGRVFSEIHLVDRNTEAIGIARGRQNRDLQRRVHLHGGVELSGWGERLPAWREAPPDDETLQRFVDESPVALGRRLPTMDVVASTCLLSQLAYQVGKELGPEHPATERIRLALLALHLRSLAAIVRPGGVALMVTDVAVAARGELEARFIVRGGRGLLEDLVAGGEVFRGTPPARIEETLATDPVLARTVARVQVLEPWLWTRTLELSYLVYGVRFWTAPAAGRGLG